MRAAVVACVAVVCMAAGGCVAPAPAVVTDAAELHGHVGRRVTLRGWLQGGKGWRVLGVNVSAPRGAQQGHYVVATGFLVEPFDTQAGSAFDASQMPVGRYSLCKEPGGGPRVIVAPSEGAGSWRSSGGVGSFAADR